MTLKTDAAQLVERLRYAHQARVKAVADRHHSLAHAAAVIAKDLVDEANAELLRAALTMAVQPGGGQPPIPVVLGPQDAAAATVGVDEVMALAYGYLEAGFAYQNHQASEGDFRGAYQRLRAAVEQLALAAFVADTGRRLS